MNLDDCDGPRATSLTDRNGFGAVNPTIRGVRLDKFVTCVKRRLAIVTQQISRRGWHVPLSPWLTGIAATRARLCLYPISTSGWMGFVAMHRQDRDGGRCLQTTGLVSCLFSGGIPGTRGKTKGWPTSPRQWRVVAVYSVP